MTMVLEQEGLQPLRGPDWQEIEHALSEIHPRTRSFFILSSKVGYVQAAGAKLRLTIEYKKKAFFSHKNYRLGREPGSEDIISLNYSGGAITVRTNEVLTLEDGLVVFRSYFEHETVPEEYSLRQLIKGHE